MVEMFLADLFEFLKSLPNLLNVSACNIDMAIYLPRSDLLILLPAKCGSTWIRRAVTTLNDAHYFLGPRELRGHGTLAFYGRNFSKIAAFIRHPYTWHVSYWNYRTFVLGFWEPERAPMDRACSHLPFSQYVACVYANLPNCVGDYYSRFIGPPNARISFIGKLESLESDFTRLLTESGVSFDVERLSAIPKANVQHTRHEDASLRHLVFQHEAKLYQEFQYSV